MNGGNMNGQLLLAESEYNPNRLLDSLIERFQLKNDAALSRALEVTPPVISKIRHNKLPIGASLLIRMHEFSEMSIAELRNLMGDRRSQYRISDKNPDKRKLAVA
jgi:plasmid maintenance system antidote protein VapI